MVEPEKPFACTIPDCGMTFTNEDHLHVHTKKHDMVLQLGLEQKAAFVADQTPTPTRFIRNCEEVGLFQDLQNVNPFDEGFKRAMETKAGVLCIDSMATSSDELHTPQMVFPLIDGDSTLHSTTNNKNITISRSSSDESGAIKEFETTTISKLTNEVTTISRIVGKTEEKSDNSKNDVRKDSVSYTNNVIKISNMVRKDSVEKNPIQTLIYEDTVIRDSNMISKDSVDKVQNSYVEIPPIMSQKSLDFIVDSLNTDFDEAKKKSKTTDEDYEVIIKLPNGKQVRMRAVDEVVEKPNAKEALRKVISEKVEAKNSIKRLNSIVVPNISSVVVPSVNSLVTGTLIPVTLVNSGVPKVPIIPLKVPEKYDKRPVKRKMSRTVDGMKNGDANASCSKNDRKSLAAEDLDSRSAASRRYRARLKETYDRQAQENKQLKELNESLLAEKAVLRNLIMEHLRSCPNAVEMRSIMEKVKFSGTEL
ncbi:unnamed protein product [Arctia plantaginis]|uniref:C2H2-type domain-containing protein n=1 Tax=Arctia plantaginis TaxID=874455 RepID=A0A8S1BIN4_ARCPL|nr:unnamed protein product [Arctia plantaginis]